MKSVRILFLSIGLMMTTAGIVKADSLKPYLIGSMKDKKNRTLNHAIAKRCDCLEDFSQELAFQMMILASKGVSPSDEEMPSIFEKDNKGRTALDIAKAMYEKTGHQGCKDLVASLEKEEEKALMRK